MSFMSKSPSMVSVRSMGNLLSPTKKLGVDSKDLSKTPRANMASIQKIKPGQPPNNGKGSLSRLQEFLSGQKYENHNKITHVDFGQATPNEMRAAEPKPMTYKDKRNMYTEKPNVLNIEDTVEDEFRYQAAAQDV